LKFGICLAIFQKLCGFHCKQLSPTKKKQLLCVAKRNWHREVLGQRIVQAWVSHRADAMQTLKLITISKKIWVPYGLPRFQQGMALEISIRNYTCVDEIDEIGDMRATPKAPPIHSAIDKDHLGKTFDRQSQTEAKYTACVMFLSFNEAMVQ